MTQSIEPRSDQMNAEDLLAGPRTFTITEVREGSSAEQPVSVFLAEFPRDRPFKPCKTVRRLMVVGWGLDSSAHVGKRMTLYRDPDVKFAGENVGGIRVSHMSGIGPKQLTISLAVTKGRRGKYVVDPLPDVPVPDLAARLGQALDAWAKVGITEQQLEGWTGEARAQWGEATLERMSGLWQTLVRREVKLAEVFPVRPGAAPAGELSDEEQAEVYEREQEARQANG